MADLVAPVPSCNGQALRLWVHCHHIERDGVDPRNDRAPNDHVGILIMVWPVCKAFACFGLLRGEERQQQ